MNYNMHVMAMGLEQTSIRRALFLLDHCKES